VAEELVGGRYRLEERLGAGGMSEVWAAEDTELGRRVAVKLLARDADPARFDREARAVAALAHPNICQLFDYGEENGRPYMVLEYLGGGTLEDRLVPGEPLPDDETARIARDLASGLAHAHERGLVHRDLKPANILFDEEGRPKIADFGIARLGGARTLTEAGTLLGTAAYISPEQAQGQPATPASDVYSFGVILYRMLTGRLPFESESALEVARMHINEPPPAPAEIRADVPPTLASVAMASLAKDPAARPADGSALAAALETGKTTISRGPTLIAGGEPTVVIPRSRPPARRPAAMLLLLAAVALLAAAGVAVAVLATRSSNNSNPTPPPRRTHSPPTTAATSAPATSRTSARSTTARTTTAASTRRTTSQATTVTQPPPPPPPTTTPPPPTTIPSTPTTVPTTVSIGTTTSPPPPPPPPSP
jgi:eukaryotic-like serine/threonine-protein kinase